jgi:hypothetical protein
LVQGKTFPLTLRFERAGEVAVIARVRRRVDAAGTQPLPEVSLGDLTITLASAPPAPARDSDHPRADVTLGSWSRVLRHPRPKTSCP